MKVRDIVEHFRTRLDERSQLERVDLMGGVTMYFNRSLEIFVPSNQLFINGTDKLYKLDPNSLTYEALYKLIFREVPIRYLKAKETGTV